MIMVYKHSNWLWLEFESIVGMQMRQIRGAWNQWWLWTQIHLHKFDSDLHLTQNQYPVSTEKNK